METEIIENKKIKDIPKLRFREFKDEWKRTKTNNIAPLQRGFDLTNSNMIPGSNPVVFSNGILKYHSEYKIEGPGVVTGRSGTIGKVTYVEENYWPHNTSLWVTDFKGNFPKFIFYFYLNFRLEHYNAGSTVPTLNRNDVHSIQKAIPSLPEQKKIASFLSSVDKKLQQLTRKRELLETYKKGVMKQLFSQEVRFKNESGKDFPEWEMKKLGEVAKYTKGFAFKSANYQKSGIRIIRVSDLSQNKIKTEVEKVFIGEENASDFEKYKLHQGNIIITTVGSKPELLESAVGRGIYINMDNQGLLNQNMLKLENIKGVDNRFIFHLINTKRYQYHIKGIARGNANQANITVVGLLQFKVSIPSQQEQQKIADFLSAIDKKIEVVSQQITQTKSFKKGLLQQMFV